MCSDHGACGADGCYAPDTDPVRRLTRAIEDLAEEDHGSLTAADLTMRVADVWTLAGDADPELARRAARYSQPTAPGGPPAAEST
jgi:hypothetical protein